MIRAVWNKVQLCVGLNGWELGGDHCFQSSTLLISLDSSLLSCAAIQRFSSVCIYVCYRKIISAFFFLDLSNKRSFTFEPDARETCQKYFCLAFGTNQGCFKTWFVTMPRIWWCAENVQLGYLFLYITPVLFWTLSVAHRKKNKVLIMSQSSEMVDSKKKKKNSFFSLYTQTLLLKRSMEIQRFCSNCSKDKIFASISKTCKILYFCTVSSLQHSECNNCCKSWF